MPWCEQCAKYWTPSAMNSDGTCPTCGREVAADDERGRRATEAESTPWHFKLLVAALISYLVWRIIDLFV